jgi:beta-lactamase class A
MGAKKKIVLIFLAAVFVLGALGSLVYFGFRGYKAAQEQRVSLQKRRLAWAKLENTLESQASCFRGEAGIIIEDLNTGWQFSLNREKLFPSASLVKIPIMAACFQAVYERKLDLNETLCIKTTNKTPGSGVLKNSAPGTVVTVDRLIEIMITHSDNTAANLLIARLGFDYFNDFFRKAGLSHTNLSRKMMDFQDRKYGVENYTSAADISSLLERIYRRQFLSSAVSQKCLAMLLRQKVNDRIPKKLPEDCPVAHKTGLERNVCHDAGIVFTPQGDFLICVLTKSRVGTRQVKEFISELSLVIFNTYRRFPYSRTALLNKPLD